MTDDSKKTDWTLVEGTGPTRNLPELIPPGRETPPPPTSKSVGGVLQQLKEGQIKRKAAIHELDAIMSTQLDVLTHQLLEASKVKKAEATVTSDKLLKELDLQFQEVVQALGLRNEGIRRETMIKLNDQTASDLRAIMDKDWPESMKEDTIEAIKARRTRFMHNLAKDVVDDD